MADPRPSTDEESAPLLRHANEAEAHEEEEGGTAYGRLKTHLQHPQHFTLFEKILLLIALLLLCLVGLGFGLFGGEKRKLNEALKHRHDGETTTELHWSTTTVTTTTTANGGGPTGAPEVCLTAECVHISSRILDSLDTSIDPCDDFYSFANNQWLKAHAIPAGRASYGVFESIDANNKKIISDILTSDATSLSYYSVLDDQERANLKVLQDYYQSCADISTLDRVGEAPLLDAVDELIQLWRGPSDFDGAEVEPLTIQGSASDALNDGEIEADGPWDWLPPVLRPPRRRPPSSPFTKRQRLTSAILYLHSRSVFALFSAGPEGDVLNDPEHLILSISQDGLGLPSKEYYQDKEVVERYEEVVGKVLKSVFEDREETWSDWTEVGRNVVGFEKRLSEVNWDLEDQYDPHKSFNLYNSSALSALFPIISFHDYYAALQPRPEYPDPVSVSTPSYFSNATTIISNIDEETLEAYFVWSLVRNYADYLGPSTGLRTHVKAWKDGLRGVDPKDEDRENTCMDTILSNVGFMVGEFYVKEAFPGRAKEYSEELIHAVIQAFSDRLPELDWLAPSDREAAERKARAIRVKIGYPTSPNTTNPYSIASYYRLNLPVLTNDFFGNIIRSQRAEQTRTWATVGRKKDRGQWFMVPSEVNAYFSPSDNEIVFPAGIMQTPMFSQEWPEYLAMGAFASVAGHELTHAFDAHGRQYDEKGRLIDWWSNSTIEKFEHLKDCIVDQYSKYYILDSRGNKHFVNSKITIGEDMADAGGHSQAFTAWKKRSENHDYPNHLLPGLNFTREQMFFIAYAQAWARKMSPEEAVRRIRLDPHSPTKYRVNGPLTNDPEFAKAFNCPLGSPLNQKNKCAVW
ncbi:zincin [Atractiella rhizophila]|nr:zincin [Atractiella rhizophila]